MGVLEFFKSRIIRLHPLVIAGSVLGLLAFLFDPFGGHLELYSTSKIVLAFFCLVLYRSNWIIKNKLGFIGLAALLFLAFIMPFSTWNWLSEPLVILFYFPLVIALGAGATFGNYYASHKPGTVPLAFIISAGLMLLIGAAYLVMVVYDTPVRKYLSDKRNLAIEQ
jgi:hypothetical protein